MKRHPLAAAVAVAVLCAIAGLTALPILSISLTAAPSTTCGGDVAP